MSSGSPKLTHLVGLHTCTDSKGNVESRGIPPAREMVVDLAIKAIDLMAEPLGWRRAEVTRGVIRSPAACFSIVSTTCPETEHVHLSLRDAAGWCSDIVQLQSLELKSRMGFAIKPL